MCMVYANCFIICVVIIINKQTKSSLSINVNYNMEFSFRIFMNVFDITKKCCNLEDNVKTYAIVPFQYFVKTWWKILYKEPIDIKYNNIISIV